MLSDSVLSEVRIAIERWRETLPDTAVRFDDLLQAVEAARGAGDNYSAAAKAIRPLYLQLSEHPINDGYYDKLLKLSAEMDAWYRRGISAT